MRALAAALACVALALGLAAAQPTTTVPGTAEAPAPEPSLGFESPQATMRGFLTAARERDWRRAAAHLDLRGRSREDGPRLARELKVALDRSLWIDVDALDDTIEGAQNDGLPPGRDLVGTVYLSGGAVKILLERSTAPDGTQEWRIGRSTTQQIPAMYTELGDAPLAELLPAPLVDVTFLDVALWQWLALAALVPLAALAAWIVTGVLRRLASPLVRRTSVNLDAALGEHLVGPVRLVIATLALSPGLLALRLAVQPQRFAFALQAALLIAAFTWLALRLIDAFVRVGEQRFAGRGPGAATVVPLARRTVKVFAVAIALLLVLANFGFNVTGIVAGLGIGGLAVALAAQKSLENLFGGLSIIADATVRIGEVCRFGERIGTVEDIGLRSTRVRTPERTLVTVPNAEFAALQLENFSARDRLLLQARVGLRYDATATQVRDVRGRLDRLLREHPRVMHDSMQVRFAGFGATSLDIEVFAYVATTRWEEFLLVREELLLGIMDQIAAAGVVLASPLPAPPVPAPAPAGGAPH